MHKYIPINFILHNISYVYTKLQQTRRIRLTLAERERETTTLLILILAHLNITVLYAMLSESIEKKLTGYLVCIRYILY